MSLDYTPLVRLVEECDSFVLTSHTRADCDAVGSQLGMLYGLQARGKKCRIINADPPPAHIRFLDAQGRVEVLGESATAADAHAADAHLILDTSAWGQLGEMADVFRDTPARRLVLDHHQSSDDLGATMLKDPTAEATGRLVLGAIDALGVELTEQMAIPLFTAIATDTGWFRFPSVSPETFTAIARLVGAGVRPSAIFQQLYDRNTAARVRLHGRVMESLQIEIDGRFAIGTATLNDFDQTGADQADTEDVVNRLLSVDGVEVAALFAAMEPGLTKVSLRSRTAADVRPVAEHFGGGGHAKAAGVRYRGSVDEARAAVLAVIAEQLASE